MQLNCYQLPLQLIFILNLFALGGLLIRDYTVIL